MKRIRKKLGLALVSGVIFLTTLSIFSALLPSTNATPTNSNISSIDNKSTTSDRINYLKTKAIRYYRDGENYNKIESLFREATTLDPYDINLKFDLASAQIMQNKLPEALHTYSNILNIDPNNFNVHLLFAVYSQINGDTQSTSNHLKIMSQIDSKKYSEYINDMELVENIIKTNLNTNIPTDLPQSNHAILILGNALATDGSMSQALIERLKIGLAAAKQYPNSKIIVSGGLPQQGITEADAMSKWLISKGINKDRIILENKSMDTIENALFTMPILEKEGLKNITIVTSASHMRRALTIFNVASNFSNKINGNNSYKNFSNLAYMDYSSPEKVNQVSQDETLKIYRDLFRTSGIWIFPEMQR